MREAVIVAGARTAVGKSHRGITRNARSDDMAAAEALAFRHQAIAKTWEPARLGGANTTASEGLANRQTASKG